LAELFDWQFGGAAKCVVRAGRGQPGAVGAPFLASRLVSTLESTDLVGAG